MSVEKLEQSKIENKNLPLEVQDGISKVSFGVGKALLGDYYSEILEKLAFLREKS